MPADGIPTSTGRLEQNHPAGGSLSSTSEPDFDFFNSIPWCSALLTSPDFAMMRTSSRYPKSLTTEDSFFGDTLKTSSTVSACLSLYRRPAEGAPRIDEVVTLAHLGSGLDGWPGMCHGGAVCTLLDEVMGQLLSINRRFGNENTKRQTFTGKLEVSYLKPVHTPMVVLLRARFEKLEGRKAFVDASLENGEGTVLSRGKAVFIAVKGKL